MAHAMALFTLLLTGSCAHVPTVPRAQSRRALLLGGAASLLCSGCAPARAADGGMTAAQRNLASLNAGSRSLSEAGVAEGDLVAELLRRTEANKERNAAIVKQQTEANAFTAVGGQVERRLVTDLDGKNQYLDAKQIRELTQQRRIACAPSVMEACRMIEPGLGDAPLLDIPAAKKLECDANGRQCKFR